MRRPNLPLTAKGDCPSLHRAFRAGLRAMLVTTAASAIGGGCCIGGSCEADCHPNCGCSRFAFPTSASVAFLKDSIDPAQREQLWFRLTVTPVEVAHENDKGRIAWYDTVEVMESDISTWEISVRVAGTGWDTTLRRSSSEGFVLPYTTPAGWLTMPSARISAPGAVCPMGSWDQWGTVPVSSDSIWVVALPRRAVLLPNEGVGFGVSLAFQDRCQD